LTFVAGLGVAGSAEGAVEWLSVIGPAQIAVQGGALLGGGLVASYLVGILRLGMSLQDLRWRCAESPQRGFGIGLLFGMVPAVGVLLGSIIIGDARWVADQGNLVAWAASGGAIGAILAPAALAEEVLFRGVPLVLFAAVMGRGWAVVCGAIVFGVAHMMNPNVTGLGMVNVALAGVLLGAVFYGAGGIWSAFGAHLGWNATLASSGAAVSGVPFDVPFLDYEPGGPAWLTGGSFGPEGGLLATVMLAATVVVAVRWARRVEA
jgi:membrane protease YdiL (CAAX protease family)